ncbi:MAG: CoA transferase [Dehalococcoidia bacterium]
MLPLLSELKVVEITNSLAPAYAGRLLADLGAEVIALEPPAGNRVRTRRDVAPHVVDYLATNKRSACLDLAEIDGDHVARQICDRAQIVLYDASVPYFNRYWLDEPVYEDTEVALCVVTPHGLRSPYADLCEDELLQFALSGIASVTPEEPADRSTERPMQLYGHQAAFIGGLTAAVAALQGWFGTQSSGRPLLLDVAVLDALASVPLISQAAVFAGHPLPKGPSARPQTVPRGFLRCREGYVYTQGGDDNWLGWAQLLGRADWQNAPLTEPAYRMAHWPELSQVIQHWLGERSNEAVYRACQEAGITAFPVNAIGQVVAHQQMDAREVFTSIGFAGTDRSFRAPRTPIRLRSAEVPATPDMVRSFGADTESTVQRLGI